MADSKLNMIREKDFMNSSPYESIEHFNAAASTWDDNPRRRQTTAAIAAAIEKTIALGPEKRAMEYGCGTASLSFLLAGRLGEIVAVDASQGMIDQVRKKVQEFKMPAVKGVVMDLATEQCEMAGFDIIMMALALHHVENTMLILSRLASMLNPGGYLAIADLAEEDGSFHGDVRVPHNGFSEITLKDLVQRAGLLEISWQVVHQVEKNDRAYDVFLLTARK